MNNPELYAKAFKQNLSIATDGGDISVALKNLKTLLEKRGESHLYARVIRKTIRLLEQDSGTKVTSRYPLSDSIKKQIGGFLKKNFENLSGATVSFETDEKILGGVRISHKDFLFDGTLNKKLHKLNIS